MPIRFTPLAALILAALCPAQATTETDSENAPAIEKTQDISHLFDGIGDGASIPTWDKETRSLKSSALITREGGSRVYEQTIRQISEDGMQLTTHKCAARIGVAGFTYTTETQRALVPYSFSETCNENDYLDTWEIDPQTQELQRITRKIRPSDVSMDQVTPEIIWQKEQAQAISTPVWLRSRNDPIDPGYYLQAPEVDERYHLSPDGNYLIYVHMDCFGAWSYRFTIYTRDGNDWMEAEHEGGGFGSRMCGLSDYFITGDGIWCIVIDRQLELCLAHLISYTEKTRGFMYRTDTESYRTPLIEAAMLGQVDVVKALLTSPKVDPGAVDTDGNDATMIDRELENPKSFRSYYKLSVDPDVDAHDAEIIALVRQAQGPAYNRGAALDEALAYWKSVYQGATQDPHHGSAAQYVFHLLRAKAEWLSNATPQQDDSLIRRTEIESLVWQMALYPSRALTQAQEIQNKLSDLLRNKQLSPAEYKEIDADILWIIDSTIKKWAKLGDSAKEQEALERARAYWEKERPQPEA